MEKRKMEKKKRGEEKPVGRGSAGGVKKKNQHQ